jgi:hypothetical protein
MPLWSARRLVHTVLLLAPLLAACSGWPDDDIGDAWVSGPSAAGISWIAWSPDATTLYWIGGGDRGTLYAMKAADRQPIALATGLSGYPSPTLSADGSEIFYMLYDSTADTETLFVAAIGADPTSIGAPRALASNLYSYLAAPNGTRVALVDQTTADTTVQDPAGGAAVDLGRFIEPMAFSPDGGALLARNAGANDATTHYVLADTTTGTTSYLSFPVDQTIWLVTAWMGESPRAVIVVNNVTDLMTGTTTALAGMIQVDALSGTLAPAFAFGWGDEDCLHPYTVAETGDHACEGFFYRLSRDDLSTGARQVVAAETVEVGNNSDLFAVSADGTWLAVAAGSGIIGEASTPQAITVKKLSPPAGASSPSSPAPTWSSRISPTLSASVKPHTIEVVRGDR